MTKITLKTKKLMGIKATEPTRGEAFMGWLESDEFLSDPTGVGTGDFIGLSDTIDPLWEAAAVAMSRIKGEMSRADVNVPETSESFEWFQSELDRVRQDLNSVLTRFEQEREYMTTRLRREYPDAF